MTRYSLTDYILSIKVPEDLRSTFIADYIETGEDSISIGGDASYVGSISINQSQAQWTTEGDATGSWVHNKSKNQVGTIEVEMTQVSDKINLLNRLFQTYYSVDTQTDGLTITLNKTLGSGNTALVATGIDCYISGRPNFAYKDTAQTQTWNFTCGKLTFSGDAI